MAQPNKSPKGSVILPASLKTPINIIPAIDRTIEMTQKYKALWTIPYLLFSVFPMLIGVKFYMFNNRVLFVFYWFQAFEKDINNYPRC
ncbi:MAG: hypothetical protein J6T67_05775, partial [Paludibacteraceae bacterium]|nr:hypothetical protein [Paludibacteraceae bacterium]